MIKTENGLTKMEGNNVGLLADFRSIVHSFAKSKEFHDTVKGGKERLRENMKDIIDEEFDRAEKPEDKIEESFKNIDRVLAEILAEAFGFDKKEDTEDNE